MRADRVFVTLQSVHAAVSRDTTPDRWVAAVRLCALAARQASLDPAVFVQVHRSTIVNLQHLAGTRRDAASRLFLRIKGHAHELPVSRAYVPLFRAM